MRKRFFLLIALALIFVIGLSGCQQKPKVVGLVVSAPDEVVAESVFNFQTMKVYRIYDLGQVELVKDSDYSISLKDAQGASNLEAGVKEVVITDRIVKDPNDKTKNLETSFKVVNKEGATSAIKEQDSFFVFQFKEITNERKVKQYAFTHHLGYSFVKDEVEKYMTIFKVGPSEDGLSTIQTDVTSEVSAALTAEPKDKYPIQYKKGIYQVSITVGGTTSSFDVVVAGGEKPIHAKSANWFDYILVIPVGWVMQLFSFGGIYGLGIIFATIIIRTLAWPIYAKTNSMSSNMAEAQPELQRIQAKYRGRTDKNSQRQMQMETMAIYKKYKVGMGSMFLPFLQMPIFIAMYQTVTRILIPGGYWAEKLSVTKFIGIDLTIGMHWTSYILAGLVGATMILLQWLSQRKPKYLKKTVEHTQDEKAAQTAKTMKIVSYVMVIMMVIFSVRSNALALYWIIGNLFSIGQTWIHKEITRKNHEKKQAETLGGIL